MFAVVFAAACTGTVGETTIGPQPLPTPDASSDAMLRPTPDAAAVIPDASVICEAPVADCDGEASNGCETNTDVDPSHCGACGSSCPRDQTCMAGACSEPSTQETHRVSGGLAHSCAIVDNGEVRCWGYGNRGQLGNGGTSSSDRPVAVRDLSGAVDVQARDYTSCARTSDGSVFCWGENENGELGDGGGGNESTPQRVPVPEAIDLGIGLNHGCVIDTEGRAHCWGDNGSGQLGHDNGRNADRVESLTDLIQIDAGNQHTCALQHTGAVHCWGDNGFGQLGDGTENNRGAPGVEVDLPGPATEISVGRRTSCARLASGPVYCWGANHYGEVNGQNSAEEIRSPSEVPGLDGLAIRDINCGGHFACALGSNGELRCWGDSRGGQQGRETRTIAPAEELESVGTVEFFDASGHHICVGVGREVRCLGKDERGQIGGGGQSTEPVRIAL
ncbi:MAG: hypothetical protein AAGF12_12980 [Myxococcota bacterium]